MIRRQAHLAADLGAEDPVSDGDDLGDAAHEAVLADLLGDAAMHVARQEVRDDADAAVVETAEQTVLELAARHCRRSELTSRRLYNARRTLSSTETTVS